MPAPVTIDSFLDLLRRSELVESARLDAWLADLTPATTPDRSYRMARKLVEDGLLTTFHAEQLLKGKHKGFRIGNYRVLERLGRGGMGAVFLAEHLLMKHRVALKVLPPDQAENAAALERFYREARSAASLNHPNIVRCYDVDRDGGVHYLVMEYVDGVNLQELVSRRGKLDIDRAAHYIAQAALGLDNAHAAGMIHRDIKPANLFVDRTGTVKVLDMGLARLTLITDPDVDSITRKYKDKSVLGTADYIAPEQALNSQSADMRADIYSLGCTFYYLLTGSPPFPAGTVTQKLVWHQIREPAPVQDLRPDLPDGLAALVRWMMTKNPDQRPQSPGEVAAVLAPWLGLSVPPPADDEIPRLCRAAQGPNSGTLSQPSASLTNRAMPRTSETGIRRPGDTPSALKKLPPEDEAGEAGSDALVEPVPADQVATTSAHSAPTRPIAVLPPTATPAPVRRPAHTDHRWVAVAAAVAAFLATVGLLCWAL